MNQLNQNKMIIINDNDTCNICGAYFQGNGYCTNGHLKPK